MPLISGHPLTPPWWWRACRSRWGALLSRSRARAHVTFLKICYHATTFAVTVWFIAGSFCGRKVVDGSKLGKIAKKRRFFVFFAPILTKIFNKNHKNWTIFCSFNLNLS